MTLLAVVAHILHLTYGHHDISVRSYLGEHALIADACIHASSVGKHQEWQCATSGVSMHQVFGTIDNKVGHTAFLYCNGFEHSCTTIVNVFCLQRLRQQ